MAERYGHSKQSPTNGIRTWLREKILTKQQYMENAIQIFNNPQFGQVRTAGSSDNPLFCLADVCKAVDLTNPSSVKARLDKDDTQLIDLHALNGNHEIIGNSLATFVTESGFYEVILFSNSPKVKPFRRWVTKEVLPSIRKTGQYSTQVPQTFAEALMLAAKQQMQIEEQQKAIETKNKENEMLLLASVKQIKTINEQGEQIIKLSSDISQMQPKVDYCDIILQSKSTVTTTQIAQDYGLSAKAFNKILEELRIQHKVNGQWILYAPYLSNGYVQSKPVNIKHSDGSIKVKLNTEWTQKGRLFLYEALKTKKVLIPLIEQNQAKQQIL